MRCAEFYSDDHIDYRDPFGSTAGRPSPHRGVDINRWPTGTPVPSLSDGVVVRSERQKGLGNVVTIRRPDGIYLGYCHLDQRELSVGEHVTAERPVGTLGNTGSLSAGPHLHVTASRSSDDPATGSVFDPLPIILDARTPPAPPVPPAPTPRPRPARKQEDTMFAFIRNPAGTITLINAATATYRHLTYGEWLAYATQGEVSVDLSQGDYDATLAQLTPAK